MRKNSAQIEKEICEILKRINPQLTKQAILEIRKGKSITDLKIIDSLNLVALLCELENAFGIQLDPEDVAIEKFQTLEAIKKILRSKAP